MKLVEVRKWRVQQTHTYPNLQGRLPKKVIQLKFCVVGEAGVGIERVSASKRWVIAADGVGIR